MGLGLFFDPLFRVPLVAGLLIALVLPPIGVMLRVRDEWLAALGLAHLAAASALAGLAVGIPAILGGPLGALIGAVAKGYGRLRGNTAYGFMILVGWTAALLIAANTPLGAATGQALIDGQLYLAAPAQLAAVVLLAGAAVLALPWLIPRLIRARFFPRHESANRLPARRWHLGFDLLVALAMAVATGTVGLMAAVALVLVPAWAAFRVAAGWRSALAISTGLGVLGYLLAFALALALDQPFGPVLVAVLLAVGVPVGLRRRAA